MDNLIAETSSSKPEIKKIDLSIDKIPEPLTAYRINEGRYGVKTFSPDKPYLITYGLSACKGKLSTIENQKLDFYAIYQQSKIRGKH